MGYIRIGKLKLGYNKFKPPEIKTEIEYVHGYRAKD